MALLDARGFSADDFARSHPRGQLPRQALVHVADVMRRGEDVPRVQSGASAMQAVSEMTRGAHRHDRGGGRRASRCAASSPTATCAARSRRASTSRAPASTQLMSAGPRTIRPEALAVEAVQIMEKHKVNQLLVVDERGALVGALNMHDLFRAKVI